MFPEFHKFNRYEFHSYARWHTSADCDCMSRDDFIYECAGDGFKLTISATEGAEDYYEPWYWRLLIENGGTIEVLPTAFGYDSPLAAYEHARAVYQYLAGARRAGNFSPTMEEAFTVEYL